MKVHQSQLLSVLTVGMLFVGCGQKSNDSSLKKEISNNEFVETSVVEDSLLKDTVGLLSVDGAKVCHAFVTGQQEVTTAAHCISGIGDASVIDFHTASGKTYKLKAQKINNRADVAILSSSQNFSQFLEKNMSFMGSSQQASKLLTVEGKQLISQENSPLFAIDGYKGILLHLYDTKKGISGAPMLDENNKIIGVHVGAVSNDNFNAIVDVSLFDSETIDVQQMFELEIDLGQLQYMKKFEQCYADNCSGQSQAKSRERLQCMKACDKAARGDGPGSEKK
jgi:hypothetical protein